MKIKIGTYEADIRSFDDVISCDIETDTDQERLSVALISTAPTVTEVNDSIKQNFEGSLVIVKTNGDEETYTGFRLDSVRKFGEAGGDGDRITIGFIKE